MTKLNVSLLTVSLAAFAAVPASAAVISGVTDDDGGTYTLSTGLTDGSVAYTDSTTQTWTSVPTLLEGAQFVQTSQGDNSNSDLEVNLSFDEAGSLFVFHSDEVADPGWLSTLGFTELTDNISLSGDTGSGDTSGIFSVFSRGVTDSDSLTFGVNDPDTDNTGLMYGIAARASGVDDGPSPIPAPASLLLLGSALFGGGLFARRRRTA